MSNISSMKFIPKWLFAFSVLMPLSACMVGPDFTRPSAKLQDQYQKTEQSQFTDAIQSSSDRLLNPVTWWSGFKDSTLNKLLAQASSENLSLQKAALRIYQARSQLGVSEATLLPTVGLGGSAARTQQPSALPQLLSNSSSGTTFSNTQALLAQANWEIDFWGKYRRGIESTLSTYASTVATYYAADVSLASEVANTYINIRNFESLLEVARTNLALQAESLRIADSRFKNGATSQLDLSQAQSQYEQTKAEIPNLLASLKKAQYAMSILLGELPDYYANTYGAIAGSLTAPAELDVGIPKDLLRRRPDVLQAEFAAAAQSALIGVNVANLYPSFSLSGYFGFQALTYNNASQPSLFTWDNKSTSIAGGFMFPLFYRGALVDQVRVQDAAFQQSILTYQNQVLVAQKEVEDALITISTTRSSSADLRRAVVAAQSAAKLSLDRYKAGQTDYNSVILAQQQLLQVQNSFVQTNSNILLGYVAAYKALGGGWSGDLTSPQLPQKMVAEMENRTDWGKVLINTHDPRLVKSSETNQ